VVAVGARFSLKTDRIRSQGQLLTRIFSTALGKEYHRTRLELARFLIATI
jgi:hypothetical protein